MTEMQIIILLDIIISLNVVIQGIWFYIWLQDRKKDNMQLISIIGYLNNINKQFSKNNNINAETSNQQLEIIDRLEKIRVNTMNTAKNTYKKR